MKYSFEIILEGLCLEGWMEIERHEDSGLYACNHKHYFMSMVDEKKYDRELFVPEKDCWEYTFGYETLKRDFETTVQKPNWKSEIERGLGEAQTLQQFMLRLQECRAITWIDELQTWFLKADENRLQFEDVQILFRIWD
jgi:hypothetical protein